MKDPSVKADRVLHRILNARQFSLKMISNVTYGYTAAGWSGRMPCADLADAIVETGRQTLENALRTVEEHKEWKAEVVYGDTDSMFVALPGRSREEAFRIGREIAATVTAQNPTPITLQFEKVYQPCLLTAKKRYVGYMYEHENQKEPILDAKGIEIIRRDSCPAVAKIQDKCVRLLFETHDLSLVKSYLQRQWAKIQKGKVSIADFVFAKEVKLGRYSANGTNPPAAILSAALMEKDPRREPLYGERIPYVVVNGEPGARLIDMVVSPETLVDYTKGLSLNAKYYIVKQIIPALSRMLHLVGADVEAWYKEMPVLRRRAPLRLGAPRSSLYGDSDLADHGRATLLHFYAARNCVVCDESTHGPSDRNSVVLCETCRRNPTEARYIIELRSRSRQRKFDATIQICFNCTGERNPSVVMNCRSLQCPAFFQRQKLYGEVVQSDTSLLEF